MRQVPLMAMEPPAVTPASAPGGNASVNFADSVDEEEGEGEEEEEEEEIDPPPVLLSTDEPVAVPWTIPVKTATGAQTPERPLLLLLLLLLLLRRCGRSGARRLRREEEKVGVEASATTATAADEDADIDLQSCIRGLARALLAMPLLYEQLQAAALEREAGARIWSLEFE